MPKGNTPPGRGMTSAWRPVLLGHWRGVAGRNGGAVAVDQPEPRLGRQGELTRTRGGDDPSGCRPGSGWRRLP